MKKVLILGATGMLGHAVSKVFHSDNTLEVCETSRIQKPSHLKFDAENDDLSELIKVVNPDWIVNCIGVIKPHINEQSPDSVLRAIKVNGILPHQIDLAFDRPVIQIATDCVYSGAQGMYSENDLHDATDVYGKTKSLGEVASESMKHLRASIIGPELGRSTSLLEWFRNQPKNAQIKGFTDHLWNGITTHHFGLLSLGIVRNDFTNFTKTHVIPRDIVTKAELLGIFASVYNRKDLDIQSVESPKSINRTLATSNPETNIEIWKLAGYENPPSIEEMVQEQRSFEES